MVTLESCRNQIDQLDNQLVALLNQRMAISEKIGKIKAESGQTVMDFKRENEILERISTKIDQEVYRDSILHLMRTLFQASRSLQTNGKSQSMTRPEKTFQGLAGYAGIPGSFGESAFIQYFGELESRARHYPTFSEVCEAILQEEIQYGILPVENTTTGAIKEVYDLIREKDLYVTGEVCLPIVHHLIGLPEAKPEALEEIFSHAQGLEQCENYLKGLKAARLVPVKNTAIGVRHVAHEKNPRLGAIGGERAAALYGLKILKPAIQNSRMNTTRFVVLSKNLEVSEDANSSSIVLKANHTVGALHDILGCFSKEQVNLFRIESRPVPERPWEYYIYLDAEGSLMCEGIQRAFREVKAQCPYSKVIGSYRKGISL